MGGLHKIKLYDIKVVKYATYIIVIKYATYRKCVFIVEK